MAYSIQAIVAAQGSFDAELPEGLAVVNLDAGIEMIPLGSAARKRYGIPFLPLTDEGDDALPPALRELCSMLAGRAPLAYIEAEYFGGSGVQAHALIAAPQADAIVAVSDHAIDEALAWLGLRSVDGKDGFASVGLDRHRETDAWLGSRRVQD